MSPVSPEAEAQSLAKISFLGMIGGVIAWIVAVIIYVLR